MKARKRGKNKAMLHGTIPFHVWLKEQRKANDLTQRDLAGSIGCSIVTIKKWEAGELRPSKDLAEILAAHFSIPLEERAAFVWFARSGGHLASDAGRPGTASSNSKSERAPWQIQINPHNNLPAPPNAFVGRGNEVTEVRELLHRPGVRLLTLSGPPGIGKTRLSLQVASELLAEPEDGLFKDGIYFVGLAPVSDRELFVSSIARVLDVKERVGHALLEDLKSALRDKKMLLVLDNFEQVVSAAPLLAEILSAAPHLKVIVTSREVLHIYGEHDYPMTSLGLPSRDGAVIAEDLLQYDAVRLFMERATSIKPDFKLAGENAPAIAEICIRLDGLPLAIELAAVQVKALPPDAIVARLESRLDLLVGGPRDLPGRQQTLRGAIDWSYDLLDEQERKLFRSLSVFVGGCTPEGVEAVAQLDYRADSHALDSLVNKSLLRREVRSGRDARFTMLETIREYALSRLAEANTGESSEIDMVRHRHAAYFLDLAERAEANLRGPEQMLWMARLEQEHDNFRAALQACRDLGDSETGLRLAAALWRFWQTRGYLSEGREQLIAMLSMSGKSAKDRSGSANFLKLRAKVLNGAGVFALMQGDYGSATPLYEESLEIYRQLSDKAGMASTLNNLANVAYYHKEFEAAVSMHEQTLAIYQELGDSAGVSKSLNNLAIVVRSQGDYARAHSLIARSLQLKRDAGDKEGVSNALNNLAEVTQMQGDYTAARALFAESLALRMELGNKRGMAETLEGLANVNALLGMVEPAARLWGAAEALREAIGTPLLSTDLDGYEREVAAARSRADAATWSAAWAEGQAMSPAQAIHYALSSSGVV
jgi:predicted ATPase/transcriptional regulator with XRE-family HTH domain